MKHKSTPALIRTSVSEKPESIFDIAQETGGVAAILDELERGCRRALDVIRRDKHVPPAFRDQVIDLTERIQVLQLDVLRHRQQRLIATMANARERARGERNWAKIEIEARAEIAKQKAEAR